ncbi:rapa [Acrasis kona]|uniref:Rapa n=1 Tax=Acrasis kona TaxID=1008807 RepID=A0AAW2YID7_9EUKA
MSSTQTVTTFQLAHVNVIRLKKIRKRAMKSTYKVLLAGTDGCGRTALVTSWIKGFYDPMLQIDVNTKNVVYDSLSYDIECVVIRGSDRDCIPPLESPDNFVDASRKCDAIMLVYSSTSRSSFDALARYSKDIRENKITKPVFIISTMCDLSDESVVNFEEGEQFALENFGHTRNRDLFFETSAPQQTNVGAAFSACTRIMVEGSVDSSLKEMYSGDISSSDLHGNSGFATRIGNKMRRSIRKSLINRTNSDMNSISPPNSPPSPNHALNTLMAPTPSRSRGGSLFSSTASSPPSSPMSMMSPSPSNSLSSSPPTSSPGSPTTPYEKTKYNRNVEKISKTK